MKRDNPVIFNKLFSSLLNQPFSFFTATKSPRLQFPPFQRGVRGDTYKYQGQHNQLKLVFFYYLPKYSLFILLLFVNSPLPLLAQEKSVLEDIKTTGLLRIAIREDAIPFGYRDLNNDWTGICLDFAAILKQQVIAKINQPVILVKLFKSTLFNRFDLVNDQVVHIECGPNSIRPNLSYNNVTFSEPFMWTGTQFLIRATDKQRVNPNGSLAGVKVGVLRYTTNEKIVSDRYPQAILQEFQGSTGRLRGVQALRQERIDAFASDGILLLGEALSQNLELGKDYLIVPSLPLDCESYGLILPNYDPQWIAFINDVLLLGETQQLYQKWIGPIMPKLAPIASYCQQQKLGSPPE